MIRAKALSAGAASGTDDSNFWQSSAEQAVRCLLHAAALGDRTSADLYRWSLSAAQAREAVMILATHPLAALSWHQVVPQSVRKLDSGSLPGASCPSARAGRPLGPRVGNP